MKLVTDVGDGNTVIGKVLSSSFVWVGVGEAVRNCDDDADEVRPNNLWVRCWYRWLLFVMFFFFFFFCFIRIVVNGAVVSVCGCRCRRSGTSMSSVVLVRPPQDVVNDSATQALLLWLPVVALLVVLRMRSIAPAVMFLQCMVMMLRFDL